MNHTDRPLTTGEVAAIFGVTATTVKRWTDSGRLSGFRTPGGHYRYERAEVDALRTLSRTGTADAAIPAAS